MLERLRSWVLRWLGLRVERDADGADPDRFVRSYENVDGEDVTATIAAKLARLTFADSTLQISDGDLTGDDLPARAALIDALLHDLWQNDVDWVTAQMLGKGGKVIVPLYSQGELRLSICDQNRLLIRHKTGNRITAASLLLDRETIEGVNYYLLSDYELQKGGTVGGTMTHVIRYRAMRDGGEPVPVTTVARWAEVPEEISIGGVDRLLLAFLRCPRDTRTDTHCHGVPITYGCEHIVAELVEHLNTYRREYKLTRPMLGLDSSLWRDGFTADVSNIGAVRRSVQDSDDPFVPVERSSVDGAGNWQYFAPAIRFEAMDARSQALCRRLEKGCGLSQGILTERQTLNYANRDEVRAAQFDTFSTVCDIRKQWEQALDDLAYAIDVLAERFGLTPAGARGQWTIDVDWGMGLVESTAETFEQYLELQSRGALSKAELRQWVKGGTLEEAQQAIDEMSEERAASSPDPEMLAAMRGAGED